MIGYVTEVDFKRSEIVTRFRGKRSTFAFDPIKFPFEEAMKVVSEFMTREVTQLLRELVEHAEKRRDERPRRLRTPSGPAL